MQIKITANYPRQCCSNYISSGTLSEKITVRVTKNNEWGEPNFKFKFLAFVSKFVLGCLIVYTVFAISD